MCKACILFIFSIFFFSCQSPNNVDLVLFNGSIHSYGQGNIDATCLVVDDGKILAIGGQDSLRVLYKGRQEIDLKGKNVYPGWHDAHAHFAGYARGLSEIDLKGCHSWDECLERIATYIQKYPEKKWIRGRGWDQNLWGGNYPTRREIDSLYPNKFIYLSRVDGHAALVSGNVLERAGFDLNTQIDGGQLLHFDQTDQLSGLLIDAAADRAADQVPDLSMEEWSQVLKLAETKLLAHGITAVTDAGLPLNMIGIIDSLQEENALHLRMNIMLSPDADAFAYAREHGKIQKPALNVLSFKLYADGALGSRGALLKKPYCDHKGSGLAIHRPVYFDSVCTIIYHLGFQANTHCIGDSANGLILHTYGKFLQGKNDRRWRIEHAQVVDSSDMHYFGEYSILPSVQPTHATSDMKWAQDRLCLERMSGAYAYHSLLNVAGILPLGTDFPVEDINPMYTLLAAVYRQNSKLEPENGFRAEEAIDLNTCLRGMTWWPAWAAFRERDWGALEPGMFADFAVYDNDLSKCTPNQIADIKPRETWIDGKMRWSAGARQIE
ncbi:MAG: amidohydrolase family protein [Bacteroidetes bacterium]|nr:amidohydrolase family protein [Bacteroidota bacterium]